MVTPEEFYGLNKVTISPKNPRLSFYPYISIYLCGDSPGLPGATHEQG